MNSCSPTLKDGRYDVGLQSSPETVCYTVLMGSNLVTHTVYRDFCFLRDVQMLLEVWVASH